jgi:hypothetical protein
VIENIPETTLEALETTLEALFEINHLVGGLRLGLVNIQSKYIHPLGRAHTKALTAPLIISSSAFFFCLASFAASDFAAVDHITLNASFLLFFGHRRIWSSGSNHLLALCEFVHSETTDSHTTLHNTYTSGAK